MTDQIQTPWGIADENIELIEGVTLYETEGHGGYHVCSTLNKLIPTPFRNEDGFYEEDVEILIPQYFLFDLLKNHIDGFLSKEYLKEMLHEFGIIVQ